MKPLLQFLLGRDDFRCARLPSLYSDFRHLKGTNPEGFVSNVQSWESGLRDAAREALIPESEDTLLISLGPTIDNALESHDFGRPMAIDAALDEAALKGRVMLLGDFLSNPHNSFWTTYPRWIARFWISIGLRYPLDRRFGGQYVFLESVKDAARRVLSHLQKASSHTDRILPLNAFEKEVNEALGPAARISANDLKILLTYLVDYDKSLLYGRDVVRLKAPEEDPSEITALDMDIASIKKLMRELSDQAEDLTTKATEANHRARAALSSQQRALAIQCLHRKAAYENLVAKRTGILAQLEDAYNRIQDAFNHVQFLKAVRLSTGILQSLNSKLGGPEDLSSAIHELQDEISVVSMASHPAELLEGGALLQDDEEIQVELQKLENEQSIGRLNTIDEKRRVNAEGVKEESTFPAKDSAQDPAPTSLEEEAVYSNGRVASTEGSLKEGATPALLV